MGSPQGLSTRQAKVSSSHRFSVGERRRDRGEEGEREEGRRRGEGVIGRLRCEVSTFLASETARQRLVGAASLLLGCLSAEDGAAGGFWIRRPAPGVSPLSLTLTPRPAGPSSSSEPASPVLSVGAPPPQG